MNGVRELSTDYSPHLGIPPMDRHDRDLCGSSEGHHTKNLKCRRLNADGPFFIPGDPRAARIVFALMFAIRNDKALRYGVPHDLWETGVSISAWVTKIATDLSD